MTSPSKPTPTPPTPPSSTPLSSSEPTPYTPDIPAVPAVSPDAQADAQAKSEPVLDAEVNAEIEAAMEAMEAAVVEHADAPKGGAAPAKLRGPRVVQAGREHRTGQVVSVGPNDIFIEFGPKELGVMERSQFKKDDELPEPGQPLEVVITRYEAQESLYICIRPGSIEKADWEMLEPGQLVEAMVTGVNKGGLELEIAKRRAFMPASQVSYERIADLSSFVGQKLQCKVSRIDRSGKGNIVLSRRDLLGEERKVLAGKLRETLKEGDAVEGTVRKIMPFGAFVDLGGVDGLVHITDLTHDRVGMGEKAVARFVSEGQKVRVQILKLDWDANRISLGLKQLQDDPFESAGTDLTEGETVTGRVTKLLDFGCFVEVAPGVEGLVHISELEWHRVEKVSDVVKPDEVVTVKVLKIDAGERKISLSIKQTKEAPERPAGGGGGRGEPAKAGKTPKGIRPREDRSGGRAARDTRDPSEILKETPALRRLREQGKTKEKKTIGSGLGQNGGLGMGLGDLKL